MHNKAVIPESDDAIKKLRLLGKNIGFITNNSLYTVDDLMNILKPFGAKTNEIVTPNLSLRQYLKKINFQKDIYVIGSQALKSLLTDAGHKVIEYNVCIWTNSVLSELYYFVFQDIWSGDLRESGNGVKEVSLKALEVCKNVGAIIIDTDVNHCYGSIQVAQVIASQIEGIELFSGMSDDLAPLGDNIFILCK